MNTQQELKGIAFDLFGAGYEPIEIVDQLRPKVSQATIYRWIKEFKSGDFSTTPIGDIDQEESPLLSGAQHQEAAPKLSGTKSILDEAGEKRSILKQFKKLLKEITAYGDGHKWKNAQLRTVLRTAERLQDETEKIFSFDPVQFELNAIWQGLESLINEFQELVFRHPVEVELYLTPEEKFEYSYYLQIEDFNEEYDLTSILSLKYVAFLEAISEANTEELEYSVSEAEDLLISTERLEENLESEQMFDELSIVQDIKEAVETLVDDANNSFIFSTAKLKLSEELEEQIETELETENE